jgi:sec-independent protein translocase protein TatC
MAKKELEHLSSMSLGDHLEELRARLILAIMGLFVGMVVCLFFGKTLIGVMSNPFNSKMQKILEEQEKEKKKDGEDEESVAQVPQAVIVTHDAVNGYKTYTSFAAIGELVEALRTEALAVEDPNDTEAVAEDDEKPVGIQEAAVIAHHPTEGFVVYLAQAELEKKLEGLLELGAIVDRVEGDTIIVKEQGAHLVSLGPVEGFMVFIKTSLLFGIVLTSPWVIWQIWAFISAGLYSKEKRYVRIVSPISAVLFITGAMFFMLMVAPQMMGFLIRFETSMGLQSLWSLQKYINMVFSLTLVFGAAFQMPIAIVFAEMLGLVSVQSLSKNRKFVALGIVIVAAMATPPDIISQISLAIPLYGLYEASIVFCRIRRAYRKKKEPVQTD